MEGVPVAMIKTKLLLTAAMLAVMLVSAGSAVFAHSGQQPGPEPRILGGTDVPNGKYSFVAALLDTRMGEPGNALEQRFCGGSLIDSDSVLTAAHCVDGISPTNLSVVVGRAQLSTNQGELREVTRIYIPDGYNSTHASTNDVAVLKLKSAVTDITPVGLALSTANSYEQPGKVHTVVGWGATMAGGTARPDQMQEGKVPVVSDAEAAKIYPGFFDPEIMIAAGETGRGVCYGDSGGPMFASYKPLGKVPPGTTPPPNSPYQYGIATFGEKVCGTKPAVYTEVNEPSIREFITTSMNK
jgi:secreted trypsin-like serine protease